MAKVTDIQDKNGATREIQDKDLANRTAKSSIASTDYVLLEDTSGAYHKIAKASFTEAVRGALGSVINSVAKGTDIAKLPVLDSNNDLGMGTLANVASVLGDAVKTLSSSDNLNNCRHGIFWMPNTTGSSSIYPANTPTPTGTPSDILLIARYTGSITVQELHFIGETWFRYGYSTMNWSTWKKVQFAT